MTMRSVTYTQRDHAQRDLHTGWSTHSV